MLFNSSILAFASLISSVLRLISFAKFLISVMVDNLVTDSIHSYELVIFFVWIFLEQLEILSQGCRRWRYLTGSLQ